MPRTEIKELDYQTERKIDTLIQELQELQVRRTYLIQRIGILRSETGSPHTNRLITGKTLRIGDTVKFKTQEKFRATSITVIKITDKRVVIKLPSGQTTYRASHNLEKV